MDVVFGEDRSRIRQRPLGKKQELPTSVRDNFAQAGHFEVEFEAKEERSRMGHRFLRNSPVSVRF